MGPLLPLALLVCLPLALQEKEVGPEHERARKLLLQSDEKECREGTELCVGLDDVPAAELLLEVLRLESDRGGFLPTAHYRDVVWGGLASMTSSAARGHVELELQKNKKSALVRQWCAELLGEYGDPHHAAALVKALDDKELGVQRAAARALGKLRFPQGEAGSGKPAGKDPRALALKALLALTSEKDPILRANALESAVRLEPEALAEELVAGLADKDAGVRCALLGATTILPPERREALASAALRDEDWRPRLEAVELLGHVASTGALKALVSALSDARPVVAARATRQLQEITGEKHTRREAWEAWWKEKGEAFDFGQARGRAAHAPDASVAGSFNGILFESDHAAFLIDTSATMAEPLKSRSSTKIAAALEELESTLTRMQGKLRFSLFAYAREVVPFGKKGSVELDPKSQEKALAFVREQRLVGAKDVYRALEAVLADPSIDTVFLLSSAEPETGLYVHWNRITWQLKELNRFRRLTVHAVAYCREEGFRVQIQKIAEATGGDFVAFE